jgi:alpha-glucosidase
MTDRYIYNYPEDFNITNATEAAVAEAAKADFPARVVHLTAPVEKIIVSPGERNLNFPPYALNNVNGPLVAHAVAPEALHHDGVVEYDIHNLWG